MSLIDPSKLNPEKLHFTIIGSTSPGVPIEKRYAIDYINRAKNILNQIDNTENIAEQHAYVDVIANSKRAIDYHINTILHCLNYLESVKKRRYSVPKKIELLQLIGITAPDILKRLNQLRNKIEHEYYIPTKSDAQDAIDIAELFYYATIRLTKLFITEMTIENEN